MVPFTFDTLIQKSNFLLCESRNFWCKEEYTSKIIYKNSIPCEFYTSKILFIFGCNPIEWLELLQQVKSLKLVIIAGTDIPFINSTIQDILHNLPTVKVWITNWLGNHPNCNLLPLFPSYTVEYSPFEHLKKNLFGIPFVRLNSIAREEFYKAIQNLPQVYPYLMKELPNTEYQKAMSTLYFCCCPMGNGFDTHRFWESLYFGAIPVVKSHPFYDALLFHYPQIPMILIEEWEDLPNCIENLSEQKYNELWNNASLDLLTHAYWENKFSSILNESSAQ